MPNRAYLQVALDFYANFDNLIDAALTSADFPRTEIVEGLADIKKIYYRI